MAEPLFNTAREAAEWRKERLAALEAALRALTEQEAVYQAGTLCVYCDNAWDAEAFEVVHVPDCPWLTAKALVGED